MINRPDFINFDGNEFFEKTAIFISDAYFIHRWKALQKLYGKNIRTFLQKLIFGKISKKHLYKIFKFHKNRFLFFLAIFEPVLYFSYLKKVL